MWADGEREKLVLREVLIKRRPYFCAVFSGYVTFIRNPATRWIRSPHPPHHDHRSTRGHPLVLGPASDTGNGSKVSWKFDNIIAKSVREWQQWPLHIWLMPSIALHLPLPFSHLAPPCVWARKNISQHIRNRVVTNRWENMKNCIDMSSEKRAERKLFPRQTFVLWCSRFFNYIRSKFRKQFPALLA